MTWQNIRHFAKDLAPSLGHKVDAENIGAYLVMVDDSDSITQFSGQNAQNVLPRCEILTDLFGSQESIQMGHGILLHGPHIALHAYERGADFMVFANHTEERASPLARKWCKQPVQVETISSSWIGTMRD
ncbi:hypothetical protein J1614_000258 [Plenodomus biglobosus]|nr:hypothetical protein J1614_000258 [Plenodomus biglobosus]